MIASKSPRSSRLSRNLIARGAVLAAAFAFSASAGADIIPSGDVSPNPSGGVVSGVLNVGSPGLGQVDVTAGSTLTANGLTIANSGTGTGVVNISGSLTTLNLTGPSATSGRTRSKSEISATER